MGKQQKFCILAEEVTRRLYNVHAEVEDDEVEEILENMIQQLKNSNWNIREIREIVISGYRGWKRRILRRVEEGGEAYRSAARSLPSRARKKLTGKVDWYKNSKKRKHMIELDLKVYHMIEYGR